MDFATSVYLNTISFHAVHFILPVITPPGGEGEGTTTTIHNPPPPPPPPTQTVTQGVANIFEESLENFCKIISQLWALAYLQLAAVWGAVWYAIQGVGLLKN